MSKNVYLMNGDQVVSDLVETQPNSVPVLVFKGELGTYRVHMDITGGLVVEKTSGHNPNITNRMSICPDTSTKITLG